MTATPTRHYGTPMPIKCKTIEAARQLAHHYDEVTTPQLVPVSEAPTRFTVWGENNDLVGLLIFATANGWVTDRAAFEAALSLLTRMTS